MQADQTFIEVQKFRRVWILTALTLLLGVFIYALVQQMIFKVPFGTHPISNISLFLFSLIPILLLVLFFNARLFVKIDQLGIYYQFFPFHLSGRQIVWKEVKSASMRTYSPIREYGGWGVRLSKNGIAYTVRGNQGLQLELVDGKKLLLGTQNSKKLESCLQKLYNS